jgi:hypothetical protein
MSLVRNYHFRVHILKYAHAHTKRVYVTHMFTLNRTHTHTHSSEVWWSVPAGVVCRCTAWPRGGGRQLHAARH